MKQITFLFIFVCLYKPGFSQIDTLRTTKKQGTTIAPVSNTSRPASLINKSNIGLGAKLPDLTIANLTITASPTGVADTYNLTISYTIRNDGRADIFTDNVNIQTYLSNENWITYGKKDLRMTGYLSAAGGWILSNIPNRGEVLAPGGSKQESYTSNNVVIARNPKPIFILTVTTANDELDKTNNVVYNYINL